MRKLTIDEKITIRARLFNKQFIDKSNTIKAGMRELCTIWWMCYGTPIQYAFIPSRFRKKACPVKYRKKS